MELKDKDINRDIFLGRAAFRLSTLITTAVAMNIPQNKIVSDIKSKLKEIVEEAMKYPE